MSGTLRVSCNGFYAHHSRPPSAQQVAAEPLSKRIAAIRAALQEIYGAPRIHAELADEDIQVGRKRVERLMQTQGLRGVSRRKFVVTTERDPRVRIAADLVVLLDAFSRRVIGWATGIQQRTQMVLDAMDMAVTPRKRGSVIHHSD